MKLTSVLSLTIAALAHAGGSNVPNSTAGIPSGRRLEDSFFQPNGYSNDEEYGGYHDFSWELNPSSNFVETTSNGTTNEPMMIFNFDTSIARPYKRFKVHTYKHDCSSIASAPEAATVSIDNRDRTALTVSVTLDQSLIGTSSYYETPKDDAMKVKFCLVVEYLYVSPFEKEVLMNFASVGVVATVDLKADFALEDIQTTVTHNEVRLALDIDYQVNASFCDLPPSTVFPQGSAFELCVSTPANASYGIDSISSLVMSQGGTGSVAVLLISEGEDSHYALTDCFEGSCRILIQIPTVFHTAESITALALHGTATIAYASNTTHYLRRGLYEEDDKGTTLPEASSGFHATVLVSSPGDSDLASSAASDLFYASLATVLAFAFFGSFLF